MALIYKNFTTTALSGVQNVMTGNIAAYSGTIPSFYLGSQFLQVNDNNSYPIIVWVPGDIKVTGIKGTLGNLPRPLYTEEIIIEANIISWDYETTNFLRWQLFAAVRDSQWSWGLYNFDKVKVINPKTAEQDFWQNKIQLTLINPIEDVNLITGSITSFAMITGSSGYIPPSGTIVLPSGSY
jgi:hypothetical protein